MTLLRRLAIRAARELARRPKVRARAKETLTNATRSVPQDLQGAVSVLARQPSAPASRAQLARAECANGKVG